METKVLTLEDMVSLGDQVCGSLVRYCLSNGYPNCNLYLTQENLQRLFLAKVNISTLIAKYGLTTTLRRRACNNYGWGAIYKFVEGRETLSLTTQTKILEGEFNMLGGEYLQSFTFSGSIYENKLRGYWMENFNLYRKRTFNPVFISAEIKRVTALAAQYKLNLKGDFHSLPKLCKCQTEMI